MIPYILAAIGGYFIGDATQSKKKTFADGGVTKKNFSVSWFDPRNGMQYKEFSSKEDAIKYVTELYENEDYLQYANKEQIPRIYDENGKEVIKMMVKTTSLLRLVSFKIY